MRSPYAKYVSCLVAAAIAGTMLPQIAYAEPSSPAGKGDDKGVVETVKGWLSGDDDKKGPGLAKPPTGAKFEIPSREKLAKGKKALPAKRIRELAERRTPQARFWQLSDGRVEAELSASPVSYRAGGKWKPVDTTVKTTKDKGFAFANMANISRSWFGTDPRRLLRFETPEGQAVSLGLLGAAKGVKPTAKGDTVTYKGLAGGADVSYQVGAGRVKENITLARRPVNPVTYVFTLDAGALRPKERPDGSIALFGENPATPVLVIPPAFMTDSRKDRTSPYGKSFSPKVTQKLTRHGKGWRLTLTPDADWLAAPGRKYPVVVDPTITIAPSASVSQDVMVRSDQPTTNFNGTWEMAAGKTSATGIARSLIKFPLTAIPAGAKIDAARLGLYYDQVHTTGTTNVDVEIRRATGAWDEATANWNNTSALAGEQSSTTVQLDDGDPGTAAVGEWPRVAGTGSGGDYSYNKNAATGESYTYRPQVHDPTDYRVEAYTTPLADGATAAPYTINSAVPAQNDTVDQSTGTAGWRMLGTGQIRFAKGSTGSIVLGDTGDASRRTMADAVRLVNPGQIRKDVGEYNSWHNFAVADTVQKWVNGTSPNHGFVVKAVNESATAPLGGPAYEAADYDYGGETSTIPRLTVTFGKVGTSLRSPTVIHSTGPELSWPAYTNTSGDASLDIVEYQLHRSTQQVFTPSSATRIAPIARTVTRYTDTTAVPTPDSSPEEIGKVYYYQIAVRTRDNQVLGSPTRLVAIPKAGRTMRLIQAGQTDTTLSSLKPTTNLNTIEQGTVGQQWLSVGNNSGTYGRTRAVVDFPTTAIPSTATVLESRMFLWSTLTERGGTAKARYDLHGLTREFTDTTATWNNANATTAWTSPGGDHSAAVADHVPSFGTDLGRHWWDATGLTQNWVKTPGSNKGALVKLNNETAAGAQERSMFLSAGAPDAQLRPLLRVIYVDATAENTYYAPGTPHRMTTNTDYTGAVTITNTTSTAWAAGERELSYAWKLPDGSDVTTPANQKRTAIPALLPGKSATVNAAIRSPDITTTGNERAEHYINWDIRKVTDGTWLSAGAGGIPPLKQDVAVEDLKAHHLGMEKFYSYTGKNTGAGSTVMNNIGAGNSVWSYNAYTNPGRGLTTFARFSYNSQDTSDTVLGHGWSAQLAGPVRLGTPLDFHPRADPTEIRLTDGDGTTLLFTKQSDGTWKAPPGVHYRLARKAGVTCTPDQDTVSDAWTFTRPDGTRFRFGCDGYLTETVDNNGNTQEFTYEERVSNNRTIKFLTYVTDPANRQSLTVDYWEKGDAAYEYINDAGAKVPGTNLDNPRIHDHVKSMTDIAGRKVSFHYTTKGLLGRITDGDGSGQPKVFSFSYDTAQSDRNVKLVRAEDPRGNGTALAYHVPGAGTAVKDNWRTKTLTDRLQGTTGFTYAVDTTDATRTDTTVTDSEQRVSSYLTDRHGRGVRHTNAKSQITKSTWDADNNVVLLEEANGARTAYCYDQKTGYPQWKRDPEQNRTGVPSAAECAPGAYPANASKYEYQTRVDGFSADLFRKTSPEGRAWQFDYDSFGNLTTVTDPKGVATPAIPDDYTTKYEYNAHGLMTKVTDANGNVSSNSGFGPHGLPATVTDALNKARNFVYDEQGRTREVTDALGVRTTQTYDVYGRPLVHRAPKDQQGGVVITTPAPVYDANDNVTTSTSPTGAVSTAVYDAADQITEAAAPQDTPTAPIRRSLYTYDKVGNLLVTTEPKGALTTTDPGDYRTVNTYDGIDQLTSVANHAGDTVSYVYDNVGNLVTMRDPKKTATPDPDDFTTKTAYDLNHRVVGTTDAAGHTTSQTYDKDSLVTSATDKENNTTHTVHDERGARTEVRVPYEGTTYRTTRFEYDRVGNNTRKISPRGVNTAAPDDFASETVYDALNRPVRQYQPYDPADPRHNQRIYTETVYDAVGRVKRTSLPPSEGQTVRNDTDHEYYDNGWAKKSTDPWSISTSYDYNELGQQTARTITSANGTATRTMGWSFFPDGKLRTKTDDGVPVGSAVVVVDNSDTQSTSATGTWPKATATGQHGYDHQTQAAGAGSEAFTWNLDVPKSGTYTAYVKYPPVSGAATTAKYTFTKTDGTTADITRNQATGAGTWVSLGSFPLTHGNQAKLQLFRDSAGTVVADGVKLVRDTAGETDDERRSFAYAYDVNGNMTSIDDTSTGTKVDAYTVVYNSLNRVSKVTEALAGQERKSTSYTYDANGRPVTVSHPDQHSAYTYDLRDLVSTVSVGRSAADTAPKLSSYTYTARGLKLKETKANQNTVDRTYHLNGSVSGQTEKKANGTLVASHTYGYDANGNKARDVAKKMNAEAHTSYLESTTDHTYDPADRLTRSTRTGHAASTDTYVHDDNANVVSQTVKGASTTFAYDRNRLVSATSAGSTSVYAYDPFGRQGTVTRGGQVVERSVYDGFDHVVQSQKRNQAGTMETTAYSFDPLDRTASKTEGSRTTDFTYLGLADEVLNEEVAGALRKSYQYSPWGERLSQVKHNTDGTTEDGYYGYNSHTDVEILTDGNGNSKATYGYTAYGSDDVQDFTGIDRPDAANPAQEAYNPYRYNAKRWDASTGTYDMGFRDYNPGLNRFTSRDMYNGALADMNLGSDPYTGSRYAFTGGNPTTFVELDGHDFGFDQFLDTARDWGRKAAKFGTKRTPVGLGIEAGSWVFGYENPVDTAIDRLFDAVTPKPFSPRGPGGCDAGSGGWLNLGETDKANGGRATGMEACLTQKYVEDNKSRGSSPKVKEVKPPGYDWARRTAAFHGLSTRSNINACHLLADTLSGSGTDLKNISTCSRGANTWQDGSTQGAQNMRRYETEVQDALEAGMTVYYKVTPQYKGSRTVAESFHMQAIGTNANGVVGLMFQATVTNELINGRNLGTYNDPETGDAVPVGGMK
ncbi:DNRLRE domain-containing protein [Streptomyces uncialis]|uniref:DNRLRE domain-containing protein n=1 Tax=Streptomyces uncialis TaxID=1048205 RepID=UPI00364F9519